jgi:UDP-N-acetylmuramoyl-L-alanyl-D-glutamate--2,6-diaminopimelate ligase
MVVGLGRAGRAAADALLATRRGQPLRVWDDAARPEIRAARDELERAGAMVSLGGDGRALLDLRPKPGCLVKSPGVPFSSPLIAAALERRLEVLDEAELGWRLDARPLIGVTGTNGKGTSAAAIAAGLRGAGMEPLLAGNTHFGPPLSAAAGCRADVIVAELSSFQLAGSPTLLPEASLFTNIGQQHWDYHGSKEAYVAAKRRMFVRGDRAVQTASLNIDDPEGRRLAVETSKRGGRVVTYGTSAAADYRVIECVWSVDHARIGVRTPTEELELDTRMPGEHNALNLVGALALVEALGLGSSATRTALAAMALPPGRFQPVREGQPFSVVVDFAHNPQGVRAALDTARPLVGPGGALRAMFAPLWVHDEEMRQATVRVLCELADEVALTTQRWRREEPMAPPPDAVKAAAASGESRYSVIARRRAAIQEVIARARPGDVVLILGRGATSVPLYDGSEHPRPFDDCDVAAAAARLWTSARAVRRAGLEGMEA